MCIFRGALSLASLNYHFLLHIKKKKKGGKKSSTQKTEFLHKNHTIMVSNSLVPPKKKVTLKVGGEQRAENRKGTIIFIERVRGIVDFATLNQATFSYL